MAEAFIVRRGGGGGSGGTLVVTSSGAGTVTVSNTVLGKSYSKSVTAGGSVTFKGLKTGEWTVTLSNGTQTATRSVTINADYSVSVAYFSATISVTYPATSTCVVTNSSGQTVASDTNTGSSTKTWTATVGATGTYTVTATATDGSGKSKSQSVSITTDGQSESVGLSYELVLFDKDKGIDRTDITGGWSKYKDGYIGYYDNNDSSGGRGCMCKTAIDMTPYTKLVIKTGSIISAISANGGLYPSYNGSEYVNLSPKISLSSDSTLALDISQVNSAKYIGFNTGIHGSYYAEDQILVSYVHLE